MIAALNLSVRATSHAPRLLGLRCKVGGKWFLNAWSFEG